MVFYKQEDLLQALKDLNVVSPQKLDEVIVESKNENVIPEEILIRKNILTEEDLGRIISDIASIPFVKLSELVIDKSIMNVIPEIVAKKQNIVAFKKDSQGIHIATNDPTNQIISFLVKKIGEPVIVHYATKKDIKDALSLYSKDVKKAYAEIINESVIAAKNKIKIEPSIIKIVDTTIYYAYQNKASDIHIEPYENKSLIRFRIDGILHDIVDLPKDLHTQVVTRVKVAANLRTDEHMAPQDGKISYKVEDEELDIRVSVVPITEGEKVVMRLLSENSRRLSLKELGLSDFDLKKVESAYKKPHGMILATGPTGSGKTTTLYAILKMLNRRDVNIMTIEDPVEYEVQGANQIQVNEKTGLTFANGLRSIVRQDPDIILVGEIRDEETADISINAAMTGHLLLSTLHTNDAATTIPRLSDMKVEPFLVSSTVNVIIAQRLVRKICIKCRVSSEMNLQARPQEGEEDVYVFWKESVPKELILKFFGDETKIRVYKGKGCEICHGTGYVGRIGIFEVLEVNDVIKEAIVRRADAGEIKKIATAGGMRSMFEDGIEKIKNGVTTTEEILRVTKE